MMFRLTFFGLIARGFRFVGKEAYPNASVDRRIVIGYIGSGAFDFDADAERLDDGRRDLNLISLELEELKLRPRSKGRAE